VTDFETCFETAVRGWRGRTSCHGRSLSGQPSQNFRALGRPQSIPNPDSCTSRAIRAKFGLYLCTTELLWSSMGIVGPEGMSWSRPAAFALLTSLACRRRENLGSAHRFVLGFRRGRKGLGSWRGCVAETEEPSAAIPSTPEVNGDDEAGVSSGRGPKNLVWRETDAPSS
jgi:hypothetical protein